MPHADSLALPLEAITSKQAFYEHLNATLDLLLARPTTKDHIAGNWITQCANAAALLAGSFENYPQFGKEEGKRVNWAGFYFIPSLFPRVLSLDELFLSPSKEPTYLLLGPFIGRPACQEIPLFSTPLRPLGVCASAFETRETVLVGDVETRVGHIACDGATRSEVVLPLIVKGQGMGVLDLDCEREDGFDEEDVVGLEEFVRRLLELIDFPMI